MPALDRNFRRDLETAVKKARRVAELGAGKALELLAVGHHEPWGSLTPEQRQLRNRLRAHGRQLGDARDPRRGTQAVTRLKSEVAYEHWHRMLFARFLAENNLLIEPQTGMSITLDECRELAREQGKDWLPVACTYAEGMLPQIFRRGDPVLEVTLPPESRSVLEDILKALPHDVFLADDSLGWVYQFWQAERKDEVNNSEKKIGADELPAVTQLFTEDYMVEFLLHNTLGAWWAGKVAQASSLRGETEEEVRHSVALAGVTWTYLRTVKDDTTGEWRPAAGTFEAWPKTAKELRVLDPCMGSGHFLVFALPILAAFRVVEEKLTMTQAVFAVLRDNLFGLEIDPRCTQIAAFNLALAAWKLGGYQPLPSLHLACSGLAPNTTEEEWTALAGENQKLQSGMERLYRLFSNAPILGSLVNPCATGGDLLVADFHELQPLLSKALLRETPDEALELAVTAQGVAKAAEILTNQFTLVATNVPYLKRGKQSSELTQFADERCPDAKADLATMFMRRCEEFVASGMSYALVTPHTWQFLGAYRKFRDRLLRATSIDMLVQLGAGAFETVSGEVVNVCLGTFTRSNPAEDWRFSAVDLSLCGTAAEKSAGLITAPLSMLGQVGQLSNPDARIIFAEVERKTLLSSYATALSGFSAGDSPRFDRWLWEVSVWGEDWEFCQTTVDAVQEYGGRSTIIFWQKERGQMYELAQSVRHLNHAAQNWLRGKPNWGKLGVAVSQMGDLPATIYHGERYDCNCCAIIPNDVAILPALWTFCSSPEFSKAVRQVDRSIKVTPHTLLKVGFDLAHWQKIAAEKHPHGLPKPFSTDPTQWLFNGHPKGADQPLHVALARLLGYRWPRQTGSSFPHCPTLNDDGLESHADTDGIVPLSALRGEASAADRLNALLVDAFSSDWSVAKLRELLTASGASSQTLDAWLRDEAFAEHCAVFHQRPFIWHVWDGLKNGFHAFVNYHRLAGSDGLGRRTLEKLIYTYLGDWIDLQRKAQKAGEEGADARLTAAEHLRRELEAILKGEPPYDLFVRWKPLHQQPIGWDPDINDGVRLNIRPWMTARPLNARGKNACILRVTPKGISWDKDRGKEPHRAKSDFPWFWKWDKQTEDFVGGAEFDGNRWNDCHYSIAAKKTARERHRADLLQTGTRK